MNKKFFDKTFKKFLQIKKTPISIWSSALASLSSLNDINFDWENINRIVNATKSHSIKGIDFVERPFSQSEALSAREAFTTSATSVVTPVVQIDDKIIGDGSPGRLSKELMKHYENYTDTLPEL